MKIGFQPSPCASQHDIYSGARFREVGFRGCVLLHTVYNFIRLRRHRSMLRSQIAPYLEEDIKCTVGVATRHRLVSCTEQCTSRQTQLHVAFAMPIRLYLRAKEVVCGVRVNY
jgi:hypothetical protein